MMRTRTETTRKGLRSTKTEVKGKKGEKLLVGRIGTEIVLARLTPSLVDPPTTENMNPLPRVLAKGRGNKS